MRRIAASLIGVALMLVGIPALPLKAETATVAVAANFFAPLEQLQTMFEEETGHELVLTSGSTGQLYAQIVNGAPFDVFLSADSEHPTRLVAEGLGDPSTQHTYAIGKLALWTHDPEKFDPLDLTTLKRTDFRWLAVANPELAPYGIAAEQTLKALSLWEPLQPRLVRGQSIAQTFAMAEIGNAELALVALSQALVYQGVARYFEVPAELYEPLRQDAVLLNRAGDNGAARAFVAWLRGPRAGEIIAGFGYGTAPVASR
ncbi:MAG TPA: molybdate ABC transporter substrate-binding protein [Gammaproteobacteria bacterium]